MFFVPRGRDFPAQTIIDRQGGLREPTILGIQSVIMRARVLRKLLALEVSAAARHDAQQEVGDVRSGLLSIKTPDAVSAGMVEQIDLSDVVLASEFRRVRAIHLREIVQQLVRVVDLFFGPWEYAQAPLIRANAGNAFRGGIDCKYAPRTGRPDRERTQASGPLDPAFRLARPESEARVVKPYLIDHCGSEGLCVAKIELLSAGGHNGGESGQIAAPERVDEVGVIEEIVARNHAPRRVGIGSVAPSVVAGCGLKF